MHNTKHLLINSNILIFEAGVVRHLILCFFVPILGILYTIGLPDLTVQEKLDDIIYELDRKTAEEFIRLRPATVRIYPTIVMRRTRLGELYESGAYQPQTLDEAVSLCAELITLFEESSVKVIRVGLHDTPTLHEDMLAGPYHPAFRELCESRRMLTKAIRLLQDKPQGSYTIAVHPKSRSKMAGNKKANLIALKDKGFQITITEDGKLPENDIIILN